MKSITKALLVCAVAVTAIAISAAPSEAAKHKAKAAASCTPGMTCTMGSGAGPNKVMACGGDGKWYGALFTPYCVGICPPACQ
jgi:hypothetical protein